MKKIKRKIRVFLRKKIDEENRKNLKNKNFSIIASNCVGGVISNSLGLKFLSPTVNMYFEAKDFIKFCENIDEYLNSELELDTTQQLDYPVVLCKDIKLYCVHYKNFEEVRLKWKERSKRINKKNIFVIMSERDGCTNKELLAFERLPFKNKVIFVHKKMKWLKNSCYIPQTELSNNEKHKIEALTSYINNFTGKRYIDKFDYVHFFNTGEIKLKNKG